MLLGARATVSAKAAAGNLLSTGEDPSFKLFFLFRLAIRQVSRPSCPSFYLILLAIPISFSNLDAFSRMFPGRARTNDERAAPGRRIRPARSVRLVAIAFAYVCACEKESEHRGTHARIVADALQTKDIRISLFDLIHLMIFD